MKPKWLRDKWHDETCIKYEVHVWATGATFWHQDGKRHREDGPACESTSGTKEWWIDNQLHREDGPAYIGANGKKEWWLNGKKLTEKEWKLRTGKG